MFLLSLLLCMNKEQNKEIKKKNKENVKFLQPKVVEEDYIEKCLPE